MSCNFETTFETKYYVFEKVIITSFEVEQCKILKSILITRFLDAEVFPCIKTTGGWKFIFPYFSPCTWYKNLLKMDSTTDFSKDFFQNFLELQFFRTRLKCCFCKVTQYFHDYKF